MDPTHAKAGVMAVLTSSAFWVPEHFVESAWHEHAPFAFWVIDKHRPRVLVELGTHHGFSYLAFCQAVARLETGTRCYAVDHWQGDEHAGYYGGEVFDALSARHDPLYSSFSQLLRTSFRDAARHFADGTVDLLHIDGAHRLEQVRDDYEVWLPKMSKRGVILFHDINVHRDDFGVFQLWEEVRHDHPHFEFDHGHGLGVIGVGPEAWATLGELFALAGDDVGASALRTVFARLGQAVINQAAAVTAEATEAKVRELVEQEQATCQLLTADLERERLATAEALRTSAELEETRQRLTADLERERLATAEATHRSEALEQRLEAASEMISSREASLAARREAAERLAAEVLALRGSTSWKATAPLRAVSRLGRRALRQARRASTVVWWAVTLQLPSHLRAYRARGQTSHRANGGRTPTGDPTDTTADSRM